MLTGHTHAGLKVDEGRPLNSSHMIGVEMMNYALSHEFEL